MYKTALNHDRGEGTFRNPQAAFEWFKNAAEMGHPDAQYDLAVCYANGEGTAADPSEAFRWMKLSAENGNVDAMRLPAAAIITASALRRIRKRPLRCSKKPPNSATLTA